LTPAQWIAAALNVGGVGVIISLVVRYPRDVYLYEIHWPQVIGAIGGSLFFLFHLYVIWQRSRDDEMLSLAHNLKKARMEKELQEIEASMKKPNSKTVIP